MPCKVIVAAEVILASYDPRSFLPNCVPTMGTSATDIHGRGHKMSFLTLELEVRVQIPCRRDATVTPKV